MTETARTRDELARLVARAYDVPLWAVGMGPPPPPARGWRRVRNRWWRRWDSALCRLGH